jgi:hypothetical protein
MTGVMSREIRWISIPPEYVDADLEFPLESPQAERYLRFFLESLEKDSLGRRSYT